jgi:heptosyltransferase II
VRKVEPDEVKRLLIRATNWVGDAVMSVPALREIRRVFRRAHITILVKPWVQDVYSAVDFIDEVRGYDASGEHRGWKGTLRLARDLRSESFDAAILLPNAFRAALIARLAQIPVRIGYARDGRGILLTHPCRIDPAVRQMHQVYYYLGILSAVSLLRPALWQDAGYRPCIGIGVSPQDLAASRELLRSAGAEEGRPLIGINPGAFFGGAKRWLPERFAAVAHALADRYGATIAIFGSEGERRIAQEIASRMARAPIILAGRTTLGQLMGVLRHCALLITNDSGTMHLAAALDVPQVAIFGSTSAVATGPLSPAAEVLRSPVHCSPCFLRECPTDLRCMTAITVEQVLASATRKLGER